MPNEYYSPSNILPGLNRREPLPSRAQPPSVAGFYVLRPETRPIPEPAAPGVGLEAYLRDPSGRLRWSGIHPGTLERMPAGKDLRAWHPHQQPDGRIQRLPQESYHHLAPKELRPGAPVPVPVPIPRAQAAPARAERAQRAAAYGFSLPRG